MIWAKIHFLSPCKSGADPLILARLPFVYDEALASTLRVILHAKVCVAHQQFPQKSASIYCYTLLIPEAHRPCCTGSLAFFSAIKGDWCSTARQFDCLHYRCPQLAHIACSAFSPVVSGQWKIISPFSPLVLWQFAFLLAPLSHAV